MSPKERGCLDSSEIENEQLGVHLYAFKNYTKSNCLLECRAATMLKTCNCLIYFYPWLPRTFIKKFLPHYNSSKDIMCNSDQLKCLADYSGVAFVIWYKEMRKLVASASFNALSNGDDNQDTEMVKGIDCNCPDNCNDVIYNQVIRKDCVLWYENIYSGNVKWSL